MRSLCRQVPAPSDVNSAAVDRPSGAGHDHGVPRLDFRPDRDGLHFANRFRNHIGPFSSSGRCGGMVYTALDYYLTRLPVPTHVDGDFGGSPVPPDGSRLGDYILARQVASIANVSASRFLSWHGFWTSDRDRVYASTHQEFDRLRVRIDRGQLTPLGLVAKSGVTDSHQVLGYGYDRDAQGRPYAVIWDNNYPDRECALRADDAGTSIVEFDVDADPTMSGAPIETWRGYFVHDDYDLSKPHRPSYQDLVVGTPMTLDPRSGTLHYSVHNIGDFPAHLSALGATGAVPEDKPLGAVLGTLPAAGDAADLADIVPGADRDVTVPTGALELGAGIGTAVAAMRTVQQQWVAVPSPIGQHVGTSVVLDVH